MQENGMRITCYHCGTGMVSKAETKAVCRKCDSHLSIYRARFCYIGNSTALSKLGDGPVTGSEFNIGSTTTGRQFVEKLHMTSPYKTRTGKSSHIYYLPGDERAAIRLFIEENTEFVRKSMEVDSPSNIFRRNWPDHLWQMLEEQWVISEYAPVDDVW